MQDIVRLKAALRDWQLGKGDTEMEAENARLRDLLRMGLRLWSDEPPRNLYPKVREWTRNAESALRDAGENGGAK